MLRSIRKAGKALSKDKYSLDYVKREFISAEDSLVLDFYGFDGWTFKTGYDCSFNTWDDCTFNTGWGCTFKTGDHCSFNTGNSCTFNTGSGCTFSTGLNCCFLLWNIDTCEFIQGDGVIIDYKMDVNYQLNADFMRMQKLRRC